MTTTTATATAIADTERLIGPRELAELLGVEVNTIYDWHRRGVDSPPRFKVGGAVRYRVSEVREWLDAQRVQS